MQAEAAGALAVGRAERGDAMVCVPRAFRGGETARGEAKSGRGGGLSSACLLLPLLLWGQQGGKAEEVLDARLDTSVFKFAPTFRAQPTETTLYCGQRGTDFESMALIGFDLSAVPRDAIIQDAKIYLRNNDSSFVGSVKVYGLLSYLESDNINFNETPSFGSFCYATIDVRASAWNSANAVDLVRDMLSKKVKWGVCLRSYDDEVHIKSRDSSYEPFLSVQYCRPVTLAVGTAGSGVGAVTLSPPSGSYAPGTVVTLTATPAAGSAFSCWAGSASGSANPTQVTMDANKAVTAYFNLAPISLSVSMPDISEFGGPVPVSASLSFGSIKSLTATVTGPDGGPMCVDPYNILLDIGRYSVTFDAVAQDGRTASATHEIIIVEPSSQDFEAGSDDVAQRDPGLIGPMLSAATVPMAALAGFTPENMDLIDQAWDALGDEKKMAGMFSKGKAESGRTIYSFPGKQVDKRLTHNGELLLKQSANSKLTMTIRCYPELESFRFDLIAYNDNLNGLSTRMKLTNGIERIRPGIYTYKNTVQDYLVRNGIGVEIRTAQGTTSPGFNNYFSKAGFFDGVKMADQLSDTRVVNMAGGNTADVQIGKTMVSMRSSYGSIKQMKPVASTGVTDYASFSRTVDFADPTDLYGLFLDKQIVEDTRMLTANTDSLIDLSNKKAAYSLFQRMVDSKYFRPFVSANIPKATAAQVASYSFEANLASKGARPAFRTLLSRYGSKAMGTIAWVVTIGTYVGCKDPNGIAYMPVNDVSDWVIESAIGGVQRQAGAIQELLDAGYDLFVFKRVDDGAITKIFYMAPFALAVAVDVEAILNIDQLGRAAEGVRMILDFDDDCGIFFDLEGVLTDLKMLLDLACIANPVCLSLTNLKRVESVVWPSQDSGSTSDDPQYAAEQALKSLQEKHNFDWCWQPIDARPLTSQKWRLIPPKPEDPGFGEIRTKFRLVDHADTSGQWKSKVLPNKFVIKGAALSGRGILSLSGKKPEGMLYMVISMDQSTQDGKVSRLGLLPISIHQGGRSADRPAPVLDRVGREP